MRGRSLFYCLLFGAWLPTPGFAERPAFSQIDFDSKPVEEKKSENDWMKETEKQEDSLAIEKAKTKEAKETTERSIRLLNTDTLLKEAQQGEQDSAN